MRIENSAVSLYGASKSVEINSKEESLKMWVGNTRPNFERVNGGNLSAAAAPRKQADTLRLSAEGKEALEDRMTASLSCDACDEEYPELSDRDKQKIFLLQKMIEHFTGKKFRFVIPKRIKIDNSAAKTQQTPGTNRAQLAQGVRRQGWGLEYDLHETHYEKQSMTFSAAGSVRTSDGRNIDFGLELNMSREFMSRVDISVRAGDAVMIDPLIINFESATAALTNNKFSFDIDNDGKEDQISFATGCSGFLALDVNNDGIINNGSELFGPESGNGFTELALYDEDGNGWIDENDDIYDRLRIWTKDENGSDQLFALGAKGIGAIYLGNAATAFDLKTSGNQGLGSIARTGIYLRENGTAGTIQHVDLAL